MFNGDLDREKFMALCCEPLPIIPSVSIKDKEPSEILDAFLEMRNNLIEYAKEYEELHPGEKPPIDGCKDCSQFRKGAWSPKEKTPYINFSMYPSPCQCKCIYCNVCTPKVEFTEELKQKYEKVFSVVDEAINRDLLAPNTRFQVACGEITIHPYKEKIYKYVENRCATFYTNAFKFDEKIAEFLSKSPLNTINLSIDAGLSDTWEKVKGFNNFEKVLDNLYKYYKASNSHNQIAIKYIVLPGINDSEEDFKNLINILKRLKIAKLDVSRDTNYKYDKSYDKTKLIYSVAILYILCKLNKINPILYNTFSKEEQFMILETAKIIAKGINGSSN